MNKHYKDHYDVVIIGASLSTLSAALTLLDQGLDILILEARNLPGGVATSILKNGQEYELSLHEMVSISDEHHPLRIRRFLEEHDIHPHWVRIPTCYRYIDKDVDVTIHPGIGGDFSRASRDIVDAVDKGNEDLYKRILKFFKLAHKVYMSSDEILGKEKISTLKIMLKHHTFMSCLGLSLDDVLNNFKLPEVVKNIISAYWFYLGTYKEDLPFTIGSAAISDYIGYGPYTLKNTSHELSLMLAEKCNEKGAQIEYNQKVDKILVNNHQVEGIRLHNGTKIKTKYVISGAYPNRVYGEMIEPNIEVNERIKKVTNSMELGVTSCSLILLLDKSYKELGLIDYCTFYSPHKNDSKTLINEGRTFSKWNFISSVSSNVVIPDASKEGTCIYSITFLPFASAFKDVTLDNVYEYQDKIINYYLELESSRLGFNLKDHIIDYVFISPYSVAKNTNSYLGSIFGYRHSFKNNAINRKLTRQNERIIKGLYFSGAHGEIGDGMSPSMNNGIIVAKELLRSIKK